MVYSSPSRWIVSASNRSGPGDFPFFSRFTAPLSSSNRNSGVSSTFGGFVELRLISLCSGVSDSSCSSGRGGGQHRRRGRSPVGGVPLWRPQSFCGFLSTEFPCDRSVCDAPGLFVAFFCDELLSTSDFGFCNRPLVLFPEFPVPQLLVFPRCWVLAPWYLLLAW